MVVINIRSIRRMFTVCIIYNLTLYFFERFYGGIYLVWWSVHDIYKVVCSAGHTAKCAFQNVPTHSV